MQESKGQRGREGERHPEKLRTRTRKRERGGGWNVLTRRFLSELPKLIISSGLAKLCQEQEPSAKPRPGQALPATTITPIPHASIPPTHSIPSPQPDSGGQIGGAACLPVRARPSLAHCHRAFACSGVLIKSFIVLHSRKELRRNTEQNGAEGRRESERGEKKREKRKGGVGGREGNGISLFFSLLLSSLLFL